MKLLIGFTGLARAGKTTAAIMAKNHFEWCGYLVDILPFASPIRDGLALMGITKDRTPRQYRKAAQLIGTDICRKANSNWWVDLMTSRINASTADVILIDDCRFINEADLINQAENGYLVYVDGQARLDLHDPIYEHASEQMAYTYMKMMEARGVGNTLPQPLRVDWVLDNNRHIPDSELKKIYLGGPTKTAVEFFDLTPFLTQVQDRHLV